MFITYKTNASLDLDAAIDLYRASTLGERRPVDDRACMQQMLDEADLTVTAWDGDQLVGISRSLTDWCYCCYLSDLAVRVSHQRHGIGKELIRRTQAELGPKATIILLAAPAAVDYYLRIGMEKHNSAWVLRGGRVLKD
ncbi:MAG: GNAT family N-acetyltransferase [Chloroflexi bacterium]|nr:GNAT family N-acetyltransferase [Chloroflexota bacterium]